MPIHDWTQVTAGTFHDFHQTWIIEIKRALNAGRLPAGYYAMAEQIAGGWGPDVLTLEAPGTGNDDVDDDDSSGDPGHSSDWSAVAVAERPPRVRHHAKVEIDTYARKASVVAVRHTSGHKVVAMIEIVSPGNKRSDVELARFIKKADEMLTGGVHLLVIDLFPPGRFDPHGLHAALWLEHTGEAFTPTPELPLTLASYIGGEQEAYIEPTAVGTPLIDMPLFLDPDRYVPVPLEMTYQSAWEAVPAVWRKAIEKGK